jgi:hypothetical protein
MQEFAQRPVNIGDNALPMESNLVDPADPITENPIKPGCFTDSRSEPFKDWGFIFEHFLVEGVYASFTRGESDTREGLPQTDSFQFATAYHLCVRQAANFALNPNTREFASALNFYRSEAFESLMVADLVAPDIIGALAEPNSPRAPLKARVVAGYFQTLQHIDAFTLLLSDHQRPRSIDPGIWAVFRTEVFRIAHWRLAFRTNERVSVRFQQVTESVEVALRREADSIGVQLVRAPLQSFVDQLIAAWEALSLLASHSSGR